MFGTGSVSDPRSQLWLKAIVLCRMERNLQVQGYTPIQIMSTTVAVRLVPVRRTELPSQPGKAHQSGTQLMNMDPN